MKVKVTVDSVIIDNDYIVNKGEYKVNPCEFDFSSEYTDDLVKKAVFVVGNNQIERAIIDNKCDIPYDVLESEMFELCVYAYEVQDDELVLRYSPTYAKVFLRDGSYRGVTGSGEVITPTQFEQYEQALNNGLTAMNNKLAEVDSALEEAENVDIDAVKVGNTSTVTITNREGTQKSVQIEDGLDYEITPEDYEEIANIVKEDLEIDQYVKKDVNDLVNYTLKTNVGNNIDVNINPNTYVMTIDLKNETGTIISTGTVDLPLETMVVNARYDSTTKEIVLTLQNGNTVRFSVADLVSGLVSESTFNSAIQQINTTLGTKANTSDIPTKTSDLTNDSGFITNSVNNLTNYYNKTEIDNMIGDIDTALDLINRGGD